MSRSRGQEIEETYHEGDLIVTEGDTGRAMYVIQQGQVRITKGVGDSEITLAVLGKGEFFGEMSVLESMPRDANARAVGTTRVLVLTPGALLVRLRRDPTFAYEMLHRLSGRIRQLNARLVDALEASGDVRGPGEVLMFQARDRAEGE